MNMVGSKIVYQTLGSYPGMPFESAMTMASERHSPAEIQHVQLCPQNHGCVDEAIDSLRAAFPQTRFRLHANVRLSGHDRHFDASSEGLAADAYFRALGALSASMGAQVYTLHAGTHQGRPLKRLFDRIAWLEDCIGHRVGVEGHYPAKGNPYWLSSWAEYAELLTSRTAFALDLSHLHIVACRSGRAEKGLTAELLASDACVEVHLSANDGVHDLHARLDDGPEPWWMPLLDRIQPASDVFYEGNEIRSSLSAASVRERMRRAVAPVIAA